jgi:hypothetical protein
MALALNHQNSYMFIFKPLQRYNIISGIIN